MQGNVRHLGRASRGKAPLQSRHLLKARQGSPPRQGKGKQGTYARQGKAHWQGKSSHLGMVNKAHRKGI
jgi:hypothetical protein